MPDHTQHKSWTLLKSKHIFSFNIAGLNPVATPFPRNMLIQASLFVSFFPS